MQQSSTSMPHHVTLALQIANFTLHIVHCTLHIAHCTLHIAHCTLHIAQLHSCTAAQLHIAYCTLHIAQLHSCTLHGCTLRTAAHCALHVAHCTLQASGGNIPAAAADAARDAFDSAWPGDQCAWVAVPLSVDQTPHRADERARVMVRMDAGPQALTRLRTPTFTSAHATTH
jgi:hypothetical protein